MSFKQFFTESEDIKGWCEISDITGEELFENDEIVGVWSIIRHWRHGGETHYFLTLDKNGEYEMFDSEGNDIMHDRFDKQPYIKAVQDWDVRKQVNLSTAEKFNDLIDEL
jgi:hypothetical protein